MLKIYCKHFEQNSS